jgi:hypothetical protein
MALRLLGQCAATIAAVSASCPQGFTALGPLQFFSNVSGADFDFDVAGPTVVAAVGFLDSSTGATKVFVQRLNESYGEWTTIVSHEPQFAQMYDHFLFRLRGNVSYVGIGIEGEGYGSVLRGGGGFDEMDGCWAFPASGESWGFDIDAPPGGAGDMRMFGWANASSLAVVTYNHSGWDTYPASDAFGPLLAVSSGATTSQTVAVVSGPYPVLAGGALLGSGAPAVTLFSVQNTTALTTLPSPPAAGGPASVIALAWGGQALCVAFDQPLNSSTVAVSVYCMQRPSASGAWVSAGATSGAVTYVHASSVVDLSLAVTPNGVASVTTVAADGSATLVRCALSGGGCSSGLWPATPIGGPGAISGARIRAAPAPAVSTLGDTVLLLVESVGRGEVIMCSA